MSDETTPDFTPDEVARLRRLLTEDDIRKTKMLYSALMDAGRIDELAEIFTEDAVCEFGPFGVWNGREEIRTNYAKVDRDNHGSLKFYAMHSTTNHWVDITGPDTAVGRSYLLDFVTEKPADGQPIVVLGLYDEKYRKVDGRWLIEHCALHFLWPNKETPEGFPSRIPV